MGKVVKLKTAKRKPTTKRKAADAWRALNRSHKVKDNRALIIAIKDPRRPGEWITGQAYWSISAKSWWWANTSPDLPGCDAISDVYDLTGALWMPMPPAPIAKAA